MIAGGHPQAPLRVLDGLLPFRGDLSPQPRGAPRALRPWRGMTSWADKEKLNCLLQELAWEAVVQHPLSGVKKGGAVRLSKGVASVLQPFVDSRVLAGAVTLVASKDKVLNLEAAGYADVAAKRPMWGPTMSSGSPR